MYVNTKLAKIDLSSENYQILDALYWNISNKSSSKFYLEKKKMEYLEKKKMENGWRPSGEPVSVLDL